MRLAFLLALAAMVVSPAAAQHVSPVATPVLKAKPKFLSGDEAAFSETAKALGHHGSVLVDVEIDRSGTVLAAVLKKSSGSDLLDGAALAAAKTAKFTPALDASGVAVPLKFVVPYGFYQYQSIEPGGGLVRYSCASFTKEMDWWDATHPEINGKPESSQLYTMLLGLRMMSNPGGMMAAFSGGKGVAVHKAQWAQTREKCRANPNKLMIDYSDQKEMIIRLSKVKSGPAKAR
jgi:TonB family protein